MTPRDKIIEAAGEYWDAAYAEGAAGATLDSGRAQAALHSLTTAIDAAIQAARADERERVIDEAALWCDTCVFEWVQMANGNNGPMYDHKADAAQEIAADLRGAEFAAWQESIRALQAQGEQG